MTVHRVLAAARTVLFVPGDRPDRFEKAAASGADLVVLDLEDAVSPAAKDGARTAVAAWLGRGLLCGVRINPPGTVWHAADLEVVSQHDCVLMMPKAEDPTVLSDLSERSRGRVALVALVETACGVLGSAALAGAPGVARLAFGSFDLAAQLGVAPTDRRALLASRSALVLASAAAGISPPLDGVTGAVADDALLLEESRHARDLGYGGRLCVHPRQVPLVAEVFAPSPAEISWAQAVLAADTGGGVTAVAGQMVDKPVLDRARAVLASRPGLNPAPTPSAPTTLRRTKDT